MEIREERREKSGVFVSGLSLTLFDGDDLIKRALIIYANDEVAH